jgi:hypothetical protein
MNGQIEMISALQSEPHGTIMIGSNGWSTLTLNAISRLRQGTRYLRNTLGGSQGSIPISHTGQDQYVLVRQAPIPWNSL